MLVASAHCPSAGDGLGYGIDPDADLASVPVIGVIQTALEEQRRLAAAAAEETAQVAAAGTEAERALRAAFAADYAKTVVPGYTVHGTAPLTDREKILQKIVLARDWDTLFAILPQPMWKPTWMLGKYSFVQNGARKYIPFDEAALSSFIFSKNYSVQPGYGTPPGTCPQSQLEQGLAKHWEKTLGTKAKFPDPSLWYHVWPMFPGGGYPGQTYGCEKYRPSTWVKMRKKVYIAVAIVAAVYLGPIVLGKISGMLSGGAAGGSAGAAAGATAGAGATTAAGAATAGATAGVATTGGTLAAGAAKAAAYLSTVQKGVDYYNKAQTINSMIKGEAPPPPINVTGSSFTDWGMNVAKDLAAKEIKDQTGEYFAKKLTEKEEAAMRAEIEALQREMAALIPSGTPMQPDPNLQPQVRDKITEMQNIERERGDTSGIGMLALLAVPAVFLLAG